MPSLADDGADDAGIGAMLQQIADYAGHPETPGRVPFTVAAAARLEELMVGLQQRRSELEGLEAEWIGKGVATVVRLAGLLSLMQWAQDGPADSSQDPESRWPAVEPAHLEAAHALWAGYYLPQAMGVFDCAGVSAGERHARRVARWLRRMRPRPREISREEVRRDALCQTVNAEAAEEVLLRLEEGGLVRLVVTRHEGAGRTRRRWVINPALR